MVGGPGAREFGGRRPTPARHPFKARASTLGATRSRLVQVLRHLGLYRDRIEARLREEREAVSLLEKERLRRISLEQEAHLRSEERTAARLAEEAARVRETGELARLVEERRTARLFKEHREFEAMTDEQRSARRLEEEIVSWLTGEDGY